MSTQYRFIEPLDVLFLRGNQLFGDPGSYGEALVPPWPSVAAGAIRSRMLANKKIDFTAFARGENNDAELGTPANPGSFTLAGFYLARQQNGKTEMLVAPPADLVISKTDNGRLDIRCLRPKTINLPSSFSLSLLPVLAQSERSKAESGYWLTQDGWQAYLDGKTPIEKQLVKSSELWSFDARVGIGMSEVTRSVEKGKLFSMQAVTMKAGVGFLAAVTGAQPPVDGLLRFGGDGRAAAIHNTEVTLPQADYDAITKAGKCRIVLTSPGIFSNGWQLAGTDADGRFSLHGVSGRLVSAAVPRAETISGWDLANKRPKAAQRVAPTGSVYWIEELQATPDALCKLASKGLWSEPCEDASRCAEGFNRFCFANY